MLCNLLHSFLCKIKFVNVFYSIINFLSILLQYNRARDLLETASPENNKKKYGSLAIIRILFGLNLTQSKDNSKYKSAEIHPLMMFSEY